MHNSIQIKNLSVSYQQLEIIKNLSLELPKPSFVGIIGLNGCGKSTFLKAICGKIDSEGTVSEPINSFAYLGQKNNISFNLSVKEMLLMGRFKNNHFTAKYTDNEEQSTYELLKTIGVTYLWEKDFKNLSGGEQQILWIVQILLQEKELFLLDEPTQQLDILNKKKVFDLLEKIVIENKKTVFCVTHDIYNLKNIEGYLINFSKKNPSLEKINNTTIEENIFFLESTLDK